MRTGCRPGRLRRTFFSAERYGHQNIDSDDIKTSQKETFFFRRIFSWTREVWVQHVPRRHEREGTQTRKDPETLSTSSVYPSPHPGGLLETGWGVTNGVYENTSTPLYGSRNRLVRAYE